MLRVWRRTNQKHVILKEAKTLEGFLLFENKLMLDDALYLLIKAIGEDSDGR